MDYSPIKEVFAIRELVDEICEYLDMVSITEFHKFLRMPMSIKWVIQLETYSKFYKNSYESMSKDYNRMYLEHKTKSRKCDNYLDKIKKLEKKLKKRKKYSDGFIFDSD